MPRALAVFRFDHEMQSRRLFDRQVCGLCSLQNPVHVSGRHDVVFEEKRTIANEAAV